MPVNPEAGAFKVEISFELGQLVLSDKMHYLKRESINCTTLDFRAQKPGLVVLDTGLFDAKNKATCL